MEGNKTVDEIMIPVAAAIRRHGISGDAFTDTYNRAYEAVIISMDVAENWRRVADGLADELSHANTKINSIVWEDADENSPAMIAYKNLRNRELPF